MDTQTNVKHARIWRQGCTMRRFFMTTDAELALASSCQRTITRDKLSVCRHEQSQRLKPRVRKPGDTVRVAGPEPQSVPRPVQEQPVPTVRVGGSSGSGTRSGVGSRASEINTDDREAKRVRVTESRGQKEARRRCRGTGSESGRTTPRCRVKVLAHKTWRVEDVVGDAADAAPEQMNSFAQSKTEVFEKIVWSKISTMTRSVEVRVTCNEVGTP